MLEERLGAVEIDPALNGDPALRPKAPGMKYRHYAPKAPMYLYEGTQAAQRLTEAVLRAQKQGLHIGILCDDAVKERLEESLRRGHTAEILSWGQGKADLAEHLYELLRDFDRVSPELIIGMPPMNFINAVINVDGSDVYITFENVTVKLPERYAVEEVMERDGQEVIFGVRPEAITDEATFVTDHPETAFEADVDVVEMLGAETYLYVTVNGSLPLTCRVDPTTSQSQVGMVCDLAIDTNRIHIFDKDTEQSIIS